MTVQDRIAGAVLGAFVADTLSLGVHWIYNPARITKQAGRLAEPIDPLPGAAKYHPNRKRGQLTHYGDQMLVLLRSVVADGGWSRDGFAERWRAMWDDYDGYVDKATRKTLDEGSSSSDDLAGAARMVPLLAVLADAGVEDFVAAAREQTALSHGSPAALGASDFCARLLHAVAHGASVVEALDRALAHDYPALDAGGHVDAARARLAGGDPADVVKEFGAHCHVPGAVPAMLYLLLKFGHSFEEALVENALAGGDSAARGILLGAILGARDGVGAIPGAWLVALEAADEIRGLLAGRKRPDAGRSRFTFVNAAGHELDGALEAPRGDIAGYAVFAHCFTCGKDIAAASRIARELAQRGIAVLRFDFTGLGNSDGDFANTDFSSNVDDLVAAADALRERHAAPALLIGHSLGGAAVLAAADRVPEARGVVTIAAPAEPDHVLHLLEGSREDIERDGQAQVKLAGRTFTIRREFLDDLEEHTLADRIGGLKRALMIMHAPQDTIVGIDNARRIFAAAKHPKSFISLDKADHLLSDRVDSEFVGAIVAAWAGRLLA